MKKRTILRISPPKKFFRWHVDFRPCPSGVAIDFSRTCPIKDEPNKYTFDRSSYLIPYSQLKDWLNPKTNGWLKK